MGPNAPTSPEHSDTSISRHRVGKTAIPFGSYLGPFTALERAEVCLIGCRPTRFELAFPA